MRDEALRTVDRLRTRLRRAAGQAAAAAAASVAPCRPRVLVLQSLRPLRTVGWWLPDQVTLAGGSCEGLQAPGDAPLLLTWEQVRGAGARRGQAPLRGAHRWPNECLGGIACRLGLSTLALTTPSSPTLTPSPGAQVQAFAPDVLVVADMQGGSALRPLTDLGSVASLPGWWLLPAVRASAVYVADAALFCRAGPRLVEGVEALARMVWGEAGDGSLVADCAVPERGVLKLSLRPGQRCRPRLLPNHFVPLA